MSKIIHASRKIRNSSQLISLNQKWSFTPKGGRTELIDVPALWETQGHLNLDGEVVYSLEFELNVSHVTGYSTLRFEAVMDTAEVSVNGKNYGRHENPFTPFEIGCGDQLKEGKNTIEVKVVDHPRASNEHIRSAHGKQGWANQEFPSPPSVYMTLGGIYRDVTLHVHDSVVVRNLSSDSNPENLKVGIEVENLGTEQKHLDLEIEIFGSTILKSVTVPPKSISTFDVSLKSNKQAKWSPESPILHLLVARLKSDGDIKDEAQLKIGLRSLKEQKGKIFINGSEIFIRAALVQGFYPNTIYAEPSDQEIRDEILKAKELGLNTLRLHIKAFDTRYLDACDELGMLLHCDIPIAEPILNDELSDLGVLADNCASAVVAQVRRDFSHPSIFIWSAMNELGLEKIEIRKQSGYKSFAIRMFETLKKIDDTRPIIENDWIDPDPDYVFRSQILTSHWYGRIDARYLKSLRDRTKTWGKDGRFFYISEFGDWGLPNMPSSDDAEFWSYHHYYSESFKNLPWTSSRQLLIDGTQKYMGVSDKLQIEVFRGTDGVNGFCVTELTDIPWELNGLLDYRRNIKGGVLPYLQAANQEILPILEFDYAGATSGEELSCDLHVHNSSQEGVSVTAAIAFESGSPITFDLLLAPNSVTHKLNLEIKSAVESGVDKLNVVITQSGKEISKNSYEVPIYPKKRNQSQFSVNILSKVGNEILDSLNIPNDEKSQFFVVGENALSPELGVKVKDLLDSGASVLVLAQSIENSRNFPQDMQAIVSTTEWGGTDFHFTTHGSKLFQPDQILTIEDFNIRPDVIFSNSGDSMWPDVTHAGVFKPMPRPRTGYIVGEKSYGAGRLITCQYRLNETQELASTQDIALSILNLLANGSN